MVCSIWNKESHGLFDYESKNSNKVAIRIQNSGGLLKNKKQITFTKEDFTVKKNVELIIFKFLPEKLCYRLRILIVNYYFK